MTKVLFVCVANGGRSVIAERIFKQLAAGRHEAGSAGSEPGAHAHAVVVEALGEIGIDASDHVPSVLDEATIQCDRADLSWQVETIWSDPGKPRTSWEFSDPKNRPIEEVRTFETRSADTSRSWCANWMPTWLRIDREDNLDVAPHGG